MRTLDKTDEVDRLKLNGAYERNSDRPTAYLDESYSTPNDAVLELNFYVLTAVVVSADARDSLRDGIRVIADGRNWHTRNVFHEQHGPGMVRNMLGYLCEGDEISLVSKSTEIDDSDPNAEEARRACLEQLLCALQGGVPNHGPCDLAVLEKRKDFAQNNRDLWVYRQAIKSGLIKDSMEVAQVRPSVENLLWLPDTVCYAVRRNITDSKGKSENLLAEIEPKVHWL